MSLSWSVSSTTARSTVQSAGRRRHPTPPLWAGGPQLVGCTTATLVSLASPHAVSGGAAARPPVADGHALAQSMIGLPVIVLMTAALLRVTLHSSDANVLVWSPERKRKASVPPAASAEIVLTARPSWIPALSCRARRMRCHRLDRRDALPRRPVACASSASA